MMSGRYTLRNVLSMQEIMKTILLIILLLSPLAFAECVDGNYHNCQATYTDADGNIYVGEWKDQNYHGQGTMTFFNGNQYTGEWKDSNFNGQGTFTFADGSQYEGEWKDDLRDGEGTYTYADGRQTVGRWKNNEYQIVKSAADCYEDKYREVAQYGQIYNSIKEQYRGLPSHFIESARNDYLEDVRRADAEYEECKRKSVN